ncbi:MAG: type 1 glutamine amidotransferase domain-containing protein [Ectothiorhodospiraceae bacterium]|nr:type 1 glutamine amidotransferase domain-containing protein [Ectothiorhodospiraceae bacterium]
MIVTSTERMPSGKATGLWLEEFAVPYLEFRKAGAEVVAASPKGGATPIDPRSNPDPEQEQAWREPAGVLRSTRRLEEIDPADFDAVFLPGGHGTMFDLPENAQLVRILEQLEASGKVIAAVCHGPAGLIGPKRPDGQALVAGRRVAVFTDAEEHAVELQDDVPFLLESRLRELGAKVETAANFQEHAIRDGKLVTGQNPPSSKRTAQLTLEALGQ